MQKSSCFHVRHIVGAPTFVGLPRRNGLFAFGALAIGADPVEEEDILRILRTDKLWN